jgi:hypothetical protein
VTWEGREKIFHQLSKMKNRFNELSVKSIASNDLMENKIDENREHMEKYMD